MTPTIRAQFSLHTNRSPQKTYISSSLNTLKRNRRSSLEAFYCIHIVSHSCYEIHNFFNVNPALRDHNWFIFGSCIAERSSTTLLFSLAKSPLTHCCMKCNRTRTFLQHILQTLLILLADSRIQGSPCSNWATRLVGFKHMGSWEQSQFRLQDCKYLQFSSQKFDRERELATQCCD